MQQDPSEGDDQWLAHPIPRTTPKALYLQFLGKGHRTPIKEGLYFIVNPPSKSSPDPEFKLGSYDDAKEKGVFIVTDA